MNRDEVADTCRRDVLYPAAWSWGASRDELGFFDAAYSPERPFIL